MKETGIIMSGNHPKLIQDELKTMTRRTLGLEKINKDPDRYSNPNVYKGITGEWFAWFSDKESSNPMIVKCPYGQVGDRLWVRETWRVESFLEGEPMLFGYKDGQTMEENEYSDTNEYESWNERVCIQSTEDAEKSFKQGLVRQGVDEVYRWDIGKSPCRWRPSIFMPRWASRITLEITDIRVERLCEITNEDAQAEGCELMSGLTASGAFVGIVSQRFVFQKLWDSLNAKRGYGWEVNPFVWVISFKVIT